MRRIHLIGNAHVDPAWMWRLGEGFESFVSTCRSALERMDENKDFFFSASSAALYAFVEKVDPSLFNRIQERITQGRWEVVGGWWIEPDCNLPSGESFLRQAKYGQEYFSSRFGRTCQVGYSIDSFGHNPNLPQLLSAAGIKYYVFMRPDEDELHLEQPYFYWRAKTGEKVLAYRIPYHYSNFQHSVKKKVSLLEESAYYHPDIPWMLFYGVGNHGGGPTKEQISQIRELQSVRKDICFSSVLAFFQELEKLNDIPEYELDIQHHAVGCYSAHSELKQLNRQAENALLRAEKFCKLSSRHGAYQSDVTTFDKAWKNILLNQFHDTLGGVSIREACDDAIELYHSSIAAAKEEERLALYSIASKIDCTKSAESLVIFNPHPFEYIAAIEFELWHPDSSEKGISLESVVLLDDEDNEFITQQIDTSGKIGGDRVGFTALLPVVASSWKKYSVLRNTKHSITPNNVHISDSIIDVFKNSHTVIINDMSDTWGHGVTRYDDIIGEFVIENVTVLETGPVRSKVRVTSSYGHSKLIEEITLYSGEMFAHVNTHLNWQEKRKLVKIRFKHNSDSTFFTTDVPNSFCQRQVDGKEYPIISWASIGNISLITNGKQSISCDPTHLSFIAARSPLFAHHVPPHENLVEGEYQDQGWQSFSYQIRFNNIEPCVLREEADKFLQPSVPILTT